MVLMVLARQQDFLGDSWFGLALLVAWCLFAVIAMVMGFFDRRK